MTKPNRYRVVSDRVAFERTGVSFAFGSNNIHDINKDMKQMKNYVVDDFLRGVLEESIQRWTEFDTVRGRSWMI